MGSSEHQWVVIASRKRIAEISKRDSSGISLSSPPSSLAGFTSMVKEGKEWRGRWLVFETSVIHSRDQERPFLLLSR